MNRTHGCALSVLKVVEGGTPTVCLFEEFVFLQPRIWAKFPYGNSCFLLAALHVMGKFLEESRGQEVCLAAAYQCSKRVLRVLEIIFTGHLSKNSLNFLLGNGARLIFVEKRWLCEWENCLTSRMCCRRRLWRRISRLNTAMDNRSMNRHQREHMFPLTSDCGCWGVKAINYR